MHELSLCRAIADNVRSHAAGRQVRRVTLRIGYFRQVVPDTLQFCWTATAEGTEFEGSELVIDHVPAMISCRECSEHTELTDPFLRCGACNSTNIDLISGEEFLIESIDLAQEAR